MGVGGQRDAPATLLPGTHGIGGWVDPRAGLDGYGKSRPPPGFDRSPDRPTRSESLYRLSYPGPLSDIHWEKSGEYDALHSTASRVPWLRIRGTLPPLCGMSARHDS